jgi:nicotinate-nucleotide pyrophosphorylase (carboxylating)
LIDEILKMSIITSAVPSLPAVLLEPLVRNALLEDLGRQDGVLAGVDLARIAFQLVDPRIQFDQRLQDGAKLSPGQEIAVIRGPARGMLTGERVALNFLCHMSGVASATASIVDSIRDSHTRVTCTRKTMPGLRMVQKYAVRVGGGSNHRFGLDDAVLIKDNHIAIAGSVQQAVERARAAIGHLVKIELEVDTLEQLRIGLDAGVEVVLLDNMGPEMLREAVRIVDGRAITEASGRITPETAPAVAATGVDLMAIGWLTHSARVLDIGLDS